MPPLLISGGQTDSKGGFTMAFKDIQTVQKFFEKMEQKDLYKAAEYLDDSFEFSGVTPHPVDKYEFLVVHATMFRGIPDWSFNFRDVAKFGEDIMATVQITGKNSGDLVLPGMAPIYATGKSIRLPEERISFRLKGKKLVSMQVDPVEGGGIQGILQQLGVSNDQNVAQERIDRYRTFWQEAFGKGNLGVIDEIFAEKLASHDNHEPFPVTKPEDLKQLVSAYRAAFPDMKISIDDIQAAGDKVFTRWSVQGTHTGDLGAFGPTGRKCRVEGIEIARFEGNKIAAVWTNWDYYGMLGQLGVRPSDPANYQAMYECVQQLQESAGA